MSSKFEPEKMEAELRAAAERARQLELELDAFRTARAELMAGQAASEREAQRLRTELQVAEEKLEASHPLRAGVRESSILTAAAKQALRSLPPSPTKTEKGAAGETGAAAAAGAAGAAVAAADAVAAAGGPTGCQRSSGLSLSTEEGAAEGKGAVEGEADGEASGEAEGGEVLWRLESWLSSLDLGAIVARAFLPTLRAQSADLRLEKQFAERLGVRGGDAEVAAMLRETAVLEQISAAISQGARALQSHGERRRRSSKMQLGSHSWVQLTPPPPSHGKFVEEREAGPPGVGEIGRVERGEYTGRHVIVLKEDGTRWQCELIKEDGGKGRLIWLEVDALGVSPLKAVSPKLFTLTFGEPKDFVGGLVKLVGEPIGHRMLGMKQEHGAAADSQVEFEVGNYGTRTTPQLEWWFVVDPSAARLEALGLSAWPTDVKLRKDPAMRHRCRAPLPLGSFDAQRAELNARLRELHTELTDEEFIGARLYTGPCFMKYNTVLRGVHGKVPFFQACFEKLCLGNRYVTTLHVIASALSKLALLGRCETVYRGMSGGELPETFRRADASRFKGGVEFGFMSTTLNREVAIEYASAGEGGIVFEIAMGFADKGAELSWLSQYPHEKEFCFPPLTGLSVRRSRVEGSALVLELLPRVAPTLSGDGAADVFYELFIEYDQDNSNELSRDEFAQLVDEAQRRRGKPPLPKVVAATVFDILDADADGVLQLTEFHPERVHQELTNSNPNPNPNPNPDP